MKIQSYMAKFQFPIRFKFMIALLMIVTFSLGTITFTMARLFHQDKTAYIYDLTSTILLHTSQEANSIIQSYQEKLLLFSGILDDSSMPTEQKAIVLKSLFSGYRDFVAISVHENGVERYSIFDAKSLIDKPLAKNDFNEMQRATRLSQNNIAMGEILIDNSTIAGEVPLMSIAMGSQIAGTQVVITAVVKLDALLSLANRSNVFETFILDRNGFSLAHSHTQKSDVRDRPLGLPKISLDVGARSKGATAEYSYNGVGMIGGFSKLDLGGISTYVQIPKSTAYLTAQELLFWLMGGALFILLISALFGIIWAQRLTRPIEFLSDAAERVRRGDFEIHLESTSRDEIGTLSTSFNNMVSELKAREKSLKEAHAKLIQSEKMSAFGQIGAGIAHEVKNPLAGILGMTQLSLRKVPSESPLHANLKTIEKETKRCKDIIDNLLKFARSEKTDFKSIKVNSVLNDAVSIVQHQLGINQVSLEISLGEGLPNILGNANQLQQVFMNLLINSQQAMNGKPGLIKLLSRTASPDMIQVSVSDNGPGIPKDIQNKIFEPFFTTKPAGVGTGLGLSVSYGIIKDHNGDIRVQSTQGKGCTFTVLLPIVSMTATASGPALQRAAS